MGVAVTGGGLVGAGVAVTGSVVACGGAVALGAAVAAGGALPPPLGGWTSAGGAAVDAPGRFPAVNRAGGCGGVGGQERACPTAPPAP